MKATLLILGELLLLGFRVELGKFSILHMRHRRVISKWVIGVSI